MRCQYTSSFLLEREQWADFIPHFDIVVLDNRGTGLNYPVKCDCDMWNQDNFNLYPQSEEEYNVRTLKRVTQTRSLRVRCAVSLPNIRER